MKVSDIDDKHDSFPSTKTERGKIFAKTGLKVGANYARYLMDRAVSKETAEEQKRALNSRNAQDIYKEFSKLRGMALKMAQSMSLDTGMLPDEFVEVMTQAQYSVPPMNRVLVRQIIKTALGSYPEQLYASFSADAIAAASIGQVHRATLKDGRAVAVKVQYPNVRQTIESDLGMARTLFRRMIKGGHFDAYFEEIRGTLLQETDYRKEGEHIEFFAEQYAHDQIVTPRYIPDLSAENVLTMTFVEGVHLDAFLASDPDQAAIDHAGQLLWDFAHEQIAGNVRTVHADMHPGNFLFREDGKLGVIDFGCVKTFPQWFRDKFLQVYRAQVEQDVDRMVELYRELEILSDHQSPEMQARLIGFFRRFGEVILQPYRAGVFDFDAPDFKAALNELFQEASTFNETVGSQHFIYVNRILVGLFAVLLKLKPRIDTRESLRRLNAAVDRIEREQG